MKAIIILCFSFFLGCSEFLEEKESSISFNSITEKDLACYNVEKYYDCISNKYPEISKAVDFYVSGDIYTQEKINNKIIKQCTEVVGVKDNSKPSLDSQIFGSYLMNKCKYQVIDYIDQRDLFIQIMYCSKKETKRLMGCDI